jgi:hypothetical protein
METCGWLVEREKDFWPSNDEFEIIPDPQDRYVLSPCGAPRTIHDDGSWECESGHYFFPLTNKKGY